MILSITIIFSARLNNAITSPIKTISDTLTASSEQSEKISGRVLYGTNYDDLEFSPYYGDHGLGNGALLRAPVRTMAPAQHLNRRPYVIGTSNKNTAGYGENVHMGGSGVGTIIGYDRKRDGRYHRNHGIRNGMTLGGMNRFGNGMHGNNLEALASHMMEYMTGDRLHDYNNPTNGFGPMFHPGMGLMSSYQNPIRDMSLNMLGGLHQTSMRPSPYFTGNHIAPGYHTYGLPYTRSAYPYQHTGYHNMAHHALGNRGMGSHLSSRPLIGSNHLINGFARTKNTEDGISIS